MEWDFTPKDVSLGKVDYTLENFLQDFRAEVDLNFSQYNEWQRERLCSLFYLTMFFKFTGKNFSEISELLKIDPEFAKIILKNNRANSEMLEAVIMSMFLRNLRETKGMLSDKENIELVNAELRQFHELHNL